MKTNIISIFLILLTGLLFSSCHQHDDDHGHDHGAEETASTEAEHGEEVHFTPQQFEAMKMVLDTLTKRPVGAFVEANGQLEVPPQNEATVTATIGANVVKIHVIEGDKVNKGDPLVNLSHPDLITIQTEYMESWNQLTFKQQELERQERLYAEKVGSGKDLQRIRSEVLSLKGNVNGSEAKLRMLGLNLTALRQGKVAEQITVTSPIDGHIRLVSIKTGQYAMPQTEMMEIVNIDHIHADLMVFEKDMHLVHEGQKVLFSVGSLGGKELEATVYSVGKAFEQNPKAIHLHADIEDKSGLLLPGMYVRGRIILGDNEGFLVPEDALARHEDAHYIFAGQQENDNGEVEWAFRPIEVRVGAKSNGWAEIELLEKQPAGTQIAMNNAYYILAEWKKGSGEHSH